MYVIMFMKNGVIATTIKIEKSLYDEFKILGIKNNSTLQGFIEKCVYLYVQDIRFQLLINTFNVPILSSNTTSSISFPSSSFFNFK